MTRKPYDGSTPAETLEEICDEIDETIDNLKVLVNEWDDLPDYYNELVRENLCKALNAAQLAYDNLRDDIEAMEEE